MGVTCMEAGVQQQGWESGAWPGKGTSPLRAAQALAPMDPQGEPFTP